jgi:hypothetical protein
MLDKISELVELVDKYLAKHDDIFFPEGYYGRECFLIDIEGFFGPHIILDYVVTVHFSKEAESIFLKRIEEVGVDLMKTETEALVDFCESIDLSYGDQNWELDPWEFIEMVKIGCEADTLYLSGEWNYLDFLDSCRTVLYDCPYTLWEDITKSNMIDIDYLIDSFKENLGLE